MSAKPTLVKKYGNRRLYDTSESRYITLEELAGRIVAGGTVRVVDAKTDADLTQATLTQVFIETRGLAQHLPIGLLEGLIRLGDDALAEFFSRWVVGALELYLQARRGLRGAASWNPLAAAPSAAQDLLARMWLGMPFAGQSSPFAAANPTAPVAPEEPPIEPPSPASSDDVAALRSELDSLREAIKAAGLTAKGRKKS